MRDPSRPLRGDADEGELMGNGELLNLQGSLKETQLELAWNKTLSELLLAELAQTKEQLKATREQMAEIKRSSEQIIQQENENWQQVMRSLKVHQSNTLGQLRR